MSVINAKNLQKSYGTLSVLADVSFSLERRQKVALVGNNGTGKTTLLRIIAGLEEPDAGTIERSRDLRVGYLPQDTSLAGEDTIGTYVRGVVGIDTLEEKIDALLPQMTDPEKSAEYSALLEQYERLGGYDFSHHLEVMLSGFGLENIDTSRELSKLSSGQKSKVMLAGILLSGVDLLLLDEPTNNLDLPALIWLEDFLQKSEAAAIIVSHDRRFLDRVVRRIFEIDWNTRTVSVTNGTYSNYLEMNAKRLNRLKEEYRLQQEEIERLTERAQEKKASAVRGAQWKGNDNDKFLRGFKRDRAAGSSRAAKAIEKRIEQMDKIDKPTEREPLSIRLEAEPVPGVRDLRLSDIKVGYETGFAIGPLSLYISYGSRVAIMGLNGSGKSTLLKTLTGELLPMSGIVDIGSGVRLGNMMQEHESLPRSDTLFDHFKTKTGLEDKFVYAALVKAGLPEGQVKKEIGSLSPGGRARYLLTLFAALGVNVLVLDEPTNHLDLEAQAALEETLATYEGSVVLVTHDRYFLETAKIDDTYVLEEGKLVKIPDFRQYVSSAEEKARKLLRLL